MVILEGGFEFEGLEKPEMRILEPEEIKLLAETIDERYRAMVLTAAYSGLRFGELGALRFDRFDALRRSIRVEENLSEVKSEFIFKAPKSDASRRTVSVPGFLVDRLAQHLAAFPDGSGLFFTAQGGGPIRRTNFRRRIWKPAVEASVGEPCTFHDLRHTIVTQQFSLLRESTQRSSNLGLDTPRSRPRWTPTDTSSMDWMRPLRTV